MNSQRCLCTFLVLLVLASFISGDARRNDVSSKKEKSVKGGDKASNIRLKKKKKSKSGKRKSKERKRRRKLKKNAKKLKKGKSRSRKPKIKGGRVKGKKLRGRGRRRKMQKTGKMTPGCQNVTCLNNMLQVLKVNKDTVSNFLKQRKRLNSR